jgi:hypothetical protein
MPQQVEIVLRFPSRAKKNKFISGLLDGWGEEYVNLTPVEDGKDCFHATTFDVSEPFEEEDDKYDDYGLEKMEGDNCE